MPAEQAPDRPPGSPQARDKTRILFFAEAVTLAHVARPVALAGALDPADYDIHLAHCPRYGSLLGDLPFTEHAIESITPEQFLAALADGKPLYSRDILQGYVEQDLALLEQLRPDIVVGDFRLSLAVSAELARVPYVTISNAYWSPLCRQHYTVPDLPVTRALGPTLAQPVFSLARPVVFAAHCRPLNQLRRRHGLRGLGFDLRKIYTHADYTLYADIPGWFDMAPLPDNHRFIGPVAWSPDCAEPAWWGEIPCERPIVYVTLGSSGQARLLPVLLAALGQLDVTALVSSAGAEVPDTTPDTTPANVYMASYLPGDKAAQLADLVICNGGSPTSHQALAEGVPVLGLTGNLDQYLNMAACERAGAGRRMRSDAVSEQGLVTAIGEMLGNKAFAARARAQSEEFQEYRFSHEFRKTINEIAMDCAARR